MNALPTAPTGLYCQGQTNPIKVPATPTFSAIFNDPDASDTATYYQIQVNTNDSFTGTTMWNSTKTSLTPVANGARTADITYAGTTLEEGETYFWEMKLWDNNDLESPWSSVNQFTQQGINTPSSLLTNGSATLIDLVLTTPYFSAIHSDPNGDSASAYQIVVNTNSTFTGTTMWDSGKVSTSINNGDRSANLQYNGTAFPRPKITYYWHIKFWDSDDTESGWSDYAQFTYTTNSFMFEGLGASGINIH
jgi:3,4-dihydroxy-2-butanone 4-phosphate synthase